jgi:hypothetical protein
MMPSNWKWNYYPCKKGKGKKIEIIFADKNDAVPLPYLSPRTFPLRYRSATFLICF